MYSKKDVVNVGKLSIWTKHIETYCKPQSVLGFGRRHFFL